jgi:uncharacterized membrane-anchored protein
MNQANYLIQKYWPLAYWLLFACFAAEGATYPGYIPRSMPLPPYPWTVVVAVWLIFGFIIWWLARLLSEKPTRSKASSLIQSVAFLALMGFMFLAFTTASDLDGVSESAGLLALCNIILMAAHGISRGLTQMRRQ